jgi:hypothetical protein
MTSRDVWRRRAVLMGVIALLVAIPVTLLVRDGDDGGEGSSTEPATTAAQPPPDLGPGVRDEGLDVSYRVPQGWEESKKASAIRLSSPDSSAEVVIAAPAPAGDAEALLDETLAAFRSQYEQADIAPGSGRDVGGLEAKGAVVHVGRDDETLRVLVAVAPGRERAYLVEVFTTGGVSGERLREAQVALNSLKLDG